MNLYEGATWIAGTKTYTLLRMWLHCENGTWTTFVAMEIKWKKRRQYPVHAPWQKIEQMLKQDNAIIQDGPSVYKFEKA